MGQVEGLCYNFGTNYKCVSSKTAAKEFLKEIYQ